MFTRAVTVIFSVFLFYNFCIVDSGRVKRVIDGREVACVNIKLKKAAKCESDSQMKASVAADAYPQIASLRDASTQKHLCGVTILSQQFALTAAHCVTRPAAEYVLQLNNLCEDPVQVDVIDVMVHDQYDELSISHDIALIRINLTMDDKAWLNRIQLPTFSFGLSGECTTFGYGQSRRDVKRISDNLLAGEMRIVSLDYCLDELGVDMAPKSTSGMLCALGNGVDSCEGDSGGPLLCDGVLEAVSSYGIGCAVTDRPGVFTSVAAHAQWIRNAMALG